MFDFEILKFILCPATGSPLSFCEKSSVLISSNGLFEYSVSNNIIILIPPKNLGEKNE